MRLYDSRCAVCTQLAVLHGVCRACGAIGTEPAHPLHDERNEHPVTGDDDDAPPSDPDPSADGAGTDDRGDAADDLPDFDLGAGG